MEHKKRHPTLPVNCSIKLLMMELINLHFDKGNGAIFNVLFESNLVTCIVEQSNSFLSEKYKNSLENQNGIALYRNHFSKNLKIVKI